MVVFPVFVSALLASFVLAEPLLSPHVVHEKRARDPLGWSRTRRMEPDVILPMRFGLTQNNMDSIEDMLMDISHPESPNYGKHWTAAKVVNHFAPSPATISAVKDWLHSEGIHSSRQRLSPSKIWVEVNASVAEVERLLKTEYHIWADSEGGERVGCHEYSIPAHMRDHIDIIKPTVHLTGRVANPSQLRKRQIKDSNHKLGSVNSGNGPKTNGKKPSTTLTLADCDQFITPVCLQALYNIHYRPLSTKRNTFGIVEFTPQAFLQPDLDMFFKNFSPSQVGQKPIHCSGVAQTTDTGFDFNGESDLDLEYAMALTNPQPITLLQTGDLVEGAGFDNWLDAVDASFCTFEGGDDPTQDGIYPDPLPGGFNGPESCGIIKPPHVVSISYGQDEVTITPKSAMRQCAEYAKIGMMGTTVLYSSGDNGVAGFGNVCLTSNGTEAVPPAGTRFNPTFPSGCPFVTSVGATQISPNKTVHDPESACEQVIFSGGGFSNAIYRRTIQ